LTSAFVPVFTGSLAKSHDAAQETFSRLTGFLISITVPLSILGILFAPEIVRLIAPGFAQDQQKFELCVLLTQIMFPYIACVSLIAMINSALSSLQIFGASAWAQVFMNITLIGGALCALPFEPRAATLLLALSVIIGGAVQIITQLPACSRAKLSLRPSFGIFNRDVKETLKLMLPATLGASVYQLTIFLSTILASALPDGSVSWLFYADRITQFPIGIFSIALASVLLPALAHASAQDNSALFERNLSNSLRFTNFVIIPMAAGLWALALPITEVLFERGAFTHESSVRTAQAIKALAFGLWATSCHSMITRAFIAKKDTVTPTCIGACSLIVGLIASLTLMGPLSSEGGHLLQALHWLQTLLFRFFETGASLGHVGLAASSSIAAAASLILIVIFFCTRLGEFPWQAFMASMSKATCAAFGMVAAIYGIQQLTLSPLTNCALSITTAVVVYILVSFTLRSAELLEGVAVIRKRLARILR
jgi:putative peptidoglycan lipid II flippase